MSVKENYRQIRQQVPSNVKIVIAAKQRTPEEILEVIEAGATDIGENYAQETERIRGALGDKANLVKWHMIGDLQTNKINRSLKIFDVIQTVDSLEKAEAIDMRVEAAGKQIISCLIEVNVGSEISKSGAKPEYETIEEIAQKMSTLKHLRLEGLMTMAPYFEDPEKTRPYFRQVKEIFEKIKALNLPNVELKTLSMGMSHSYKVAIEEDANMIRIGTAIFGERNY